MNSTSSISRDKVIKGMFFALTAAILWGVSGSFGQFVFQEKQINVEWLISVRMLISGILLLILSSIKSKEETFRVWKNPKDALHLFIFSITGMLGVQYAYFLAIRHSDAATATVLQFAGPVLIAIYLAVKGKRFPSSSELIAIALAVIGTFLLVTHADINSLRITPLAFVFGMASAVALAIYTLQPVKLLSKYNAAAIIGWGMLIGGIAFSFVKAPWQVEGIWDVNTWTSVIFIIVFGTLVAFYTYLSAVKILGGQQTSLLTSAEPLSATLVAVVWLHTPFYWIDYLGSICIISTMFLLSYKSKNKPVIEEVG